jgi:hypothetical protein
MSKKLIIICPHCESEIEVTPANDDLSEFNSAVTKAGKELKTENGPPPKDPPKDPPEKDWLDETFGGGE